MSIKFSIGIYLVRIAQIRLHRIILWTVIGIMEIFSIFFFFLFILQCRPSAYFWTQYTGGKGTCINPDFLVAVTYTYSAIACVTDWLYAIMPAFILWKLKIDRRTKISVGMLMALGARYASGIIMINKFDLRLTSSSASITTVIRIPYLKGFRDTADFLYATTDVAIWTTAELGIGISAASLATLRPLLRQVMGESPLAFSERITTGSWRGKSGPIGQGYIRSASRTGPEAYGLTHHASIHAEGVASTETFVDSERGRDMSIQPIASIQHLVGSKMIGCAFGGGPEEWERYGIRDETLKSTVCIRD